MKLIIGNRNYSSWSLRAWLFLTEGGWAFETGRIPLWGEQWQREIGRYTPAGRVPVLVDGDITVWDTAAIYEYVLERYPDGQVGWPEDIATRAHARSLCAEMHGGFSGVRSQLPQNLRARRPPPPLSEATQGEIQRLQTMWSGCYDAYGGPWLCGDFSLTDVVYAPVALRFVTYGIVLDPAAQWFVEQIQQRQSIAAWVNAAAAETEVLAAIDEI